jgi:hypothetical protein
VSNISIDFQTDGSVGSNPFSPPNIKDRLGYLSTQPLPLMKSIYVGVHSSNLRFSWAIGLQEIVAAIAATG